MRIAGQLAVAVLAVLCIAEHGPGRRDSSLDEVLACNFNGRALRAHLTRASSSADAAGECVLAFRTVLGLDGGRRLAQSVRRKIVCRRGALLLLDGDIEAAARCSETLSEWLATESREAERLTIALLLVEAESDSEMARRVVRRALEAEDWERVLNTVAQIGVRRLEDVFVDDLASVALRWCGTATARRLDGGAYHPSGWVGDEILGILALADKLPAASKEKIEGLIKTHKSVPAVLHALVGGGAEELSAIRQAYDCPQDARDAVVAALLAAPRIRVGEAAKIAKMLRAHSREDVRLVGRRLASEVTTMKGERSSPGACLTRRLERDYGGRSIRTLLRRANSRPASRSAIEVVLAFRANFGTAGPHMLGRVLRTNVVVNQEAWFTLLALEPEASRGVLAELRRVARSSEVALEHKIMSSVLYLVNEEDAALHRFLYETLTSDAERSMDAAVWIARFPGVARSFVEDAERALAGDSVAERCREAVDVVLSAAKRE